MPIIQKAGAIVLSRKDPALVALFYRAKQDDWSFPKGHVEAGEDVADTTRREILEETGLVVLLIETLPVMEYDHPNGDHVVVHMFLARSEDDLRLKPEFDGDAMAWVEYAAVGEVLSYDNIKEYYKSIFPRIENAITRLRRREPSM